MIHHLRPMTARSIYLKATLIILLVQTLHLNSCSHGFEANPDQPEESKPGNCNIFKYVGVNDLSVNDVVVKSATSSLACIKARFSLAIKVEAAPEDKLITESEHHLENGEREHTENDETNEDSDKRLLLGYLPLDTVINVEDSCPDVNPDLVTKDGHQAEKGGRLILNEPRELEMRVAFECGKLTFNFKRQENYYVSAIRGVVNLDSNTIREFAAEEPMFFTSDLSHHFKFNELIEVNSSAETKTFILTANFYNLEFETFRNTSSRDFIRPPDDKSRPFPRW